MYRNYRYRLNPTQAQELELDQAVETLRRVYNRCLTERKKAWDDEKRSVNKSDQVRREAADRNVVVKAHKNGEPGPHWIARVSAVAVNETIHQLDKAYQHFFRRVREGIQPPGYPKYKKYGHLHSIGSRQYGSTGGGGIMLVRADGRKVGTDADLIADEHGKLRGYRVKVFGVGSIRVRMHRPIRGTIKTVRVKRHGTHWYLVLCCDLGPAPSPEASCNPPTGIDLGLEHFLTTSDGDHVANPRFLRKGLKHEQTLSRMVSRRKPANPRSQKSRRYNKARRALSRHRARVADRRKEFHHRISNELVRRYGTICVENLNVQGMMRNGKYSRSIGDAGWSAFLAILKLKAQPAGVSVVDVDPRGTSQNCSECGTRVPKTLDVRWHDCPACGLSLQRDHNAARNILFRGHPSHEAGMRGLRSPVRDKGRKGKRSSGHLPCPDEITANESS